MSEISKEALADAALLMRAFLNPPDSVTYGVAVALQQLMDERDAVFDDVTRSCELASENLQNAYEALEERAEAAEADLARMGAECSGQERTVSKLGRQLADMTSRMQLAENKLAELVRRVRYAYGAGGSAREETLRLWAILTEYEAKPATDADPMQGWEVKLAEAGIDDDDEAEP